MLLMGDEVGRSQGGNNNTWCQDTPLSWMIWSQAHCDTALLTYAQRLLKVRSQLAELINPLAAHSEPPPPAPSADTTDQPETPASPAPPISAPEGLWRQWHGVELQKPDWASWSHCLAYSVQRGSEGAALWIGFNAYFKAMHFDLPEPTSPWCRLIDTALTAGDDLPTVLEPWSPKGVPLEARSLVVMVARDEAAKLKL